MKTKAQGKSKLTSDKVTSTPSLLKSRENKRPSSPNENVVVDCGWGRLLFANTFLNNQEIVSSLRREKLGRRDIVLYVKDPQVILSLAPQDLFLDPSHTLRLYLKNYNTSQNFSRGFHIRPVQTQEDIEEANRIFKSHNMVEIPQEFALNQKNSKKIILRVAEDNRTHKIIGITQGVDHTKTFDDPENGSSMWSLAVESQAELPGIGMALVNDLALTFKNAGRSFMDLSVLDSNKKAMKMYEKIGFEVIGQFFIKRKNPINEILFIGSPPETRMNPYAKIIINEARRRGIGVEIIDEESGYFNLTFGGRSLVCHESLSEITSAIAFNICSDKTMTRRLLCQYNLSCPDQMVAGDKSQNESFFKKYERIVVKPAVGEQGKGITINPQTVADLHNAVRNAKQVYEQVLLEEFIEGEDLRIIVINFEVIAAAIRQPAQIVGDNKSTVKNLLIKQSRRRASATGNESRIPIDDETERCVREKGYTFDSVLPLGEVVPARKTANLHTGGTITDVTSDLHPALAQAAIMAAEIINIPVVGFDFIVDSPEKPDYKIIEANERPGLANHEPQPTAERFIDLLFPQTKVIPILKTSMLK